jgi:hypothetical protein
MTNRRQEALDYLGERTGTLEYRFLRYAAVADELFAQGMDDSSILADLGAGACDFDFYLRTVRGWKGRYLPVDASIDGTDFEKRWLPRVNFDFVVAIELLEHLHDPYLFVVDVTYVAGVFIATTPNIGELGADYVKEIDRTHVFPLDTLDLCQMGAERVDVCSFFGKPNDSLLAVWT